MKRFSYKGVKKDGGRISGKITAVNREEAVGKLLEKGMLTERINEDIFFGAAMKIAGDKIRKKDVLGFMQEVNMLLDGNMPVNTAVEIIKEQKRQKVGVSLVAYRIYEQMEGGRSFYESCRYVFGGENEVGILLSVIRIGEESGRMEEALKSVYKYYKRESEIRSNVDKALVYPKIVICCVLLAMSFIMTYVVPKFKNIFESIGAQGQYEMPLIIRFSDFLNANKTFVFLLLLLVLLGFNVIFRSGKIYIVERLVYKIPYLGEMKKLKVYIGMLEIIALLSSRGVDIYNAFEIMGDFTDDKLIRDMMLRIKTRIGKGRSLKSSIGEEGFFDEAFKVYIQMAEELGSYEDTFFRLADKYSSRLENLTEKSLEAFQPFLMILVSLLIGLVAISILQPMFDLLNSVEI